MDQEKKIARAILIGALVTGISFLHYGTHQSYHHYHIFYRELYFVPIILAGFWFGLRGALWTSLSISAVYTPFVLANWQGFSPNDFSRVMEILLYNTAAAILGVLIDRHEAEHERLLKAESLAAVGRAVSGVAHDMKTPLIAIGGFTKMVQRNMREGDPCYQKLDIVIHETLRLEKMVKDMLDFSRPLELCLVEEDLHEVIRRSITIVEESAKERKVKIECRFSDRLSPILCDSTRMEQVFVNLLMNAVQASPEGESVKVTTVREGDCIRVDISDCGCGIPPEQREEIFAPFFTTKKEGTGLGLPIVKKIVEAHDGRLELSDNSERGVTFSVLLPLRNADR